MNVFKKVIPVLLVWGGMLLAFSGCEGVSGHQDVMELIKAADKPVESMKPTEALPSAPLVIVKEPYQGGPFYTQSRKSEIGRFQCSSCHTGKDVTINQAKEAAHGDIKLFHGAVDDPNACDTCHNLSDRDYLGTDSIAKIDFDHSYQLCGTCHFRQKKDWVGGAHGKRVQNWAGQRVVQNCTGCHNPHSPRFSKRWPATFSLPDSVLPDQEDEG